MKNSVKLLCESKQSLLISYCGLSISLYSGVIMFHSACDPSDDLQDFLQRDLLNGSSSREAPYKIEYSGDEGRYLVATRDIEAGEGILTEEALFWSPRYSTRPLCLVCYGYLYSHDICHPCQCGWPLCSEECLNSIKDSDHSAECRLYASKPEKKPDYRKFNFAGIEPLYDVIAPLRLLTEKGRSNKWDTAMKLMSHLGDWKESPGWIKSHDAVKEQILSLFPVDYTDEEEIYTIFGIFYTNDFGVRVNAGEDASGNPVLCPKIRQLYTLTSLLSHDCTPNTLRVIHSTVKEKFRVEVKAKMGIQKGEKINGTYIDTFAPTIIRKKVLRESKLFDCKCNRCTEINDGDGGSDLICPNCKKTAVCQGKDLSYICESCKTPFPEGRDTLIQHYEALEDILEDPMRCSVEDFEAFILERKDVLHPRNLIFIRLMYSLIGFYGRLSGYEMHQMTAKMLRRKWEAGEEVRKALEAFDHGISTYKGMTYYELHMPMIMLTKMDVDAGNVDLETAKNIFHQALNFLKDSCTHLQYDNLESFEGQVFTGASLSVIPLESFITQI